MNKFGKVVFVIALALFFAFSPIANTKAVESNFGKSVIDVGIVMHYWEGYLGYTIAENHSISLTGNFNNYYKVNSGYYNVTTKKYSDSVLNHSGYSVSFYRTVPVPALYRGYIANLNQLPMTVNSVWIRTT